MKTRTKSVLLISMICILLVGMFTLVGCVANGKLAFEKADDTGICKLTANNVAKNSGLSTGSVVKIEKGQILVVSPDLQKGSIHIRLLNESGEAAFEESVSGQELKTKELEPGKYSIGATCGADGTTGKVLVAAVNAEEFEKQNQDLEAALAASTLVDDSASSESAGAANDSEQAVPSEDSTSDSSTSASADAEASS